MNKLKSNLLWTGQTFLWIAALLFIPVDNSVLIPLAQAQENCETALADAERMYVDGRLPEVLERLTQCLPEGIPKNDRVGAYRLLAFAYLAQDNLDNARESVKNLLTLNRKYQPDPNKDSPRFIALVEEIRPTIPTPLTEKLFGGIKKWFWVGGAGVLVAWFIPGPNPAPDPDPDLPGPPDLPNK